MVVGGVSKQSRFPPNFVTVLVLITSFTYRDSLPLTYFSRFDLFTELTSSTELQNSICLFN